MTRLLYVLDSATADDARLFADRLGYLSSELTREILDWVEQFTASLLIREGLEQRRAAGDQRGRVQRAGSRHATARAHGRYDARGCSAPAPSRTHHAKAQEAA